MEISGKHNTENWEEDEQPTISGNHRLVFVDCELQAKVFQGLDMMRRNRHFCDVILNVGNHEIYAHRAILSSASQYLFELFTNDNKMNRGVSENIITYKLNGRFDWEAFESLVNYSYTAKLEICRSKLNALFLAASRLKMASVVKACIDFMSENLDLGNCLEIRALRGVGNNPELVNRVDDFITANVAALAVSPELQALSRIQIEVIQPKREEMDHINPRHLCQLGLDWIKRQREDEDLNLETFMEKSHLLYLTLENSLQDASELPTNDASNTEIVRQYKKKNLKDGQRQQSKLKLRSKGDQPAKPRVLLYSRSITESIMSEPTDADWKLIAFTSVELYSHIAVVTINGSLATLSIVQRLNQPVLEDETPPTPPSRGSSTERLDSYCSIALMSESKCAVGCAELKGYLLVCGGYDRGECLRTVEMYDPVNNKWTNLARMREARGRFNIAVIGDTVYAVGGSNGTNELATLESFSWKDGSWEHLAPLPVPRSNAGVCSVDGKLYCIGGWSGQYGIKQCNLYTPKTNEWSSISPLNTGRYQAGVCAAGGKIYVLGGCDSWNCLNTAEVYDIATDTWTYMPKMSTARRGCGAAFFNGKLYLIGGSDGTHSLCSTEVFDPNTGIWTSGPNLTACRANVGVTVVAGKLFAVGGFTGKSFLNSAEYLDLDLQEWSGFITKGDEFCSLPNETGSSNDSFVFPSNGGTFPTLPAASGDGVSCGVSAFNPSGRNLTEQLNKLILTNGHDHAGS